MASGTPNYANGAIFASSAVVATGDTSRTSPTNNQTVVTPGSNGARIERISMCAVGATTASFVRFFIKTSSTFRIWKEFPLPAVTPAAGVTPVWQASLEAVNTPDVMPLLLPSGSTLEVCVNDTQGGGGICVTAHGGNF